MNLRHSFVITSTNISSRLSWEAPASESAITGYQVVWGQILPASHNMMMDKSTSITKSLPKVFKLKNEYLIKIISYSDKNTVDLFVGKILFHTNVHYRTRYNIYVYIYIWYRISEFILNRLHRFQHIFYNPSWYDVRKNIWSPKPWFNIPMDRQLPYGD